MINESDCVTLSDEESPSVVSKNSGNRNKFIIGEQMNSDCVETIEIDEELSQHGCHNYNNNNIELPDSQQSANQGPILKLDKIHKENELFSKFIDKCLDLERSDGMIRIIKKNVIKFYELSDKDYRVSPEFRRVLVKAIRRLEMDPNHKFSHVKDVVETMKLHKPKKRLKLTTLATNLKEHGTKSNGALQIHNCSTIKSNNSSIVIDSDDEQKEIPTIDLDDYLQDEIIDLVDKNTEEEKENHVQDEENIQNSRESFLTPHSEVTWTPGVSIVPVEFEHNKDNDNMNKIKIIEESIASLKEKIVQLEEAEVDCDSTVSPYILCDKFKAQVVQLYKQLCELKGEQPVKRRKVRLQVLEGHPPGPVRRLETFINDNIGADGNPLFPDFCDVVKCVVVANVEDMLGWSKQDVMTEAMSLFTHCGRALQKERQRREYRDLLSRVKVEQPGQDPADGDPDLLRKLNENKRIAVKKEHDVLERYVQLQYVSQTSKPGNTASEANAQIAPYSNGILQHNSFPTDTIHNELSETHLNCHGQIDIHKLSHTILNNHGQTIVEEPSGIAIDNHEQMVIDEPDSTTINNHEQPFDSKLNNHGPTIIDEPSRTTKNNHGQVVIDGPSDTNLNKQGQTVIDEPSSTTINNHEEPSDSNLNNQGLTDTDELDQEQIVADDQYNTNPNYHDQPQTSPNDTISDEDSNFEPPEVKLSQEVTVEENEIENIGLKVKQEPMDVVQMLEELGDNFTASVIDIEDPFSVIEISSDDDSSDEEISVESE